MKQNILVLCTGNSCRSQMAHGYLNLFGGDRVNVYSAGLETHGVNPRAIAVMKEDGVDISGHTSNNVSEYQSLKFDYVLTVCDHAREHCPYVPAVRKSVHRNFPDPAKVKGEEAEVLAAFRAVRDSIREYARQFMATVVAPVP